MKNISAAFLLTTLLLTVATFAQTAPTNISRQPNNQTAKLTKYTFFVHSRATREWLALTKDERHAFVKNELNPVFVKYSAVKVRFFDTEAFNPELSDIIVFETTDLEQYRFMIFALRTTKFFTVPYFEFTQIYTAVENDFAEYEKTLIEVQR